MRTACLLVLLVAGCERKRQSEPEEQQPRAKTGTELPQPTVGRDKRLSVDGICSHYADKMQPHPMEGGRVLFHVDRNVYHSTDGEERPVVEFASDKGFRQPKVIFRLADATGWAKGQARSMYVEGVLRGFRPFKSLPWASPWYALTPQPNERFSGSVVVVDDARIVSPP